MSMAVIAGVSAGILIFVTLMAVFGKNNSRGDTSSDGSAPMWFDFGGSDHGGSDHGGGDGGSDGGGGGD